MLLKNAIKKSIFRLPSPLKEVWPWLQNLLDYDFKKVLPETYVIPQHSWLSVENVIKEGNFYIFNSSRNKMVIFLLSYVLNKSSNSF